MRDLLEQIERGLDQNLYYLALFSALSLPDICGAVDSVGLLTRTTGRLNRRSTSNGSTTTSGIDTTYRTKSS